MQQRRQSVQAPQAPTLCLKDVLDHTIHQHVHTPTPASPPKRHHPPKLLLASAIAAAAASRIERRCFSGDTTGNLSGYAPPVVCCIRTISSRRSCGSVSRFILDAAALIDLGQPLDADANVLG
jgi:hypothetical protein